MRRGPWKLMAPLRDGAAPELYHLGDDPAESKDLAAANPEVAARLLKAWEDWQVDVVKSAEEK